MIFRILDFPEKGAGRTVHTYISDHPIVNSNLQNIKKTTFIIVLLQLHPKILHRVPYVGDILGNLFRGTLYNIFAASRCRRAWTWLATTPPFLRATLSQFLEFSRTAVINFLEFAVLRKSTTNKKRIQNSVENLRWSFLRKYLTTDEYISHPSLTY